jgi:DNA-binding SARP family transcriptional activator
MPVQFEVLGPVRVLADGGALPLAGQLRLRLLALLLARANTPVPADSLIEALWGDRRAAGSAESGDRQRLQTAMHKLRRALGEPDRLTFSAGHYQLHVETGELDAHRFDTLLAEAANAEDAAVRAGRLRDALRLWHGDPFQGIDLVLLAGPIQRLDEARMAASEDLLAAELECGRHEMVVAEAAELLELHPLRERLHTLLMTALYRSGRQADALAAYQRARQQLHDQLGLDPGPELRAAELDVLNGRDPSGAGSGPRILPVLAQLPPVAADFLGRKTELEELDRLLEGRRPAQVVVVSGTAGVGKTALATHWSYAVRDRFPDGQLYVDLHGFSPHDPVSPLDALGGFLRAMGESDVTIPWDLTERAAKFRTLTDRRKLLIFLDNAATADQVRPLLPGAASCLTVITSRDALDGLVTRDGARRIVLGRMDLADSRELVLQRIGAPASVSNTDGRTEQLIDELIERCARLPLALRITAERLQSRAAGGLPELVDQLAVERTRLDLLETGDEQASVRAVLSWSYRQLSPPAARLFRMCGFHCLHPGHYLDRYAAAALLATDDIRQVDALLDDLRRRGLLEDVGEGRFLMHDLIRSYAVEMADQLESGSDARRRLLDYYLTGAHRAVTLRQPPEVDLRTVGYQPMVTREMGDPEAADQWLRTELTTLAGVAEIAAQAGFSTHPIDLSILLWRYLDQYRRLDEARRIHTIALRLAAEQGDRTAEGIALRGLGLLALRQGRDGDAEELLRQALELHDNPDDAALRATTAEYLDAQVQPGSDPD